MTDFSPNLESEAIIHDEVLDENNHVTQEEVIEYALLLGIEPIKEAHLLPFTRSWLLEPLPSDWKPCWSESQKVWFYHNLETQESSWEHPLNQIHREKVLELRLRFAATDVAKSGIGLEREAPEGEAAETTLDSVCSVTMLPSSLTRSLPGASKTNPPKTLAPLRRVPKLDTDGLTTPNFTNGLALSSTLSPLSLGKVPALASLSKDSAAANATSLSFTERLAAKRASTAKLVSNQSEPETNKLGLEQQSILSGLNVAEAKQGILRDLNSGVQRLGDGSSGKRVQFSLDLQSRGRPQDELRTLVRDVEDEIEEDFSLSESESQPHTTESGDNDLLGMLGDASDLKPSRNSPDMKPISESPVVHPKSNVHKPLESNVYKPVESSFRKNEELNFDKMGESDVQKPVESGVTKEQALSSSNKSSCETYESLRLKAEEELAEERQRLQTWLQTERERLKSEAETQLERSRRSLEEEFRLRHEALQTSVATKEEAAREVVEREKRAAEAEMEQRVTEEKRKQSELLAGELEKLEQRTQKALEAERDKLQTWLETTLKNEKTKVEDQLKQEQAKWQSWLETEIAALRKSAENDLEQARQSWQRRTHEQLQEEEAFQKKTVEEELTKLRKEFSEKLNIQREKLTKANAEEVQELQERCEKLNAAKNADCVQSTDDGDTRWAKEVNQSQVVAQSNCQCDSLRSKLEVLEAQLNLVKNETGKVERENFDKLRAKYGQLKRMMRTAQAQLRDQEPNGNGFLSDSSFAVEADKAKSFYSRRTANRVKDQVRQQQRARSSLPVLSPSSSSSASSSSSDESRSEMRASHEDSRYQQRNRTRSRSMSSLRSPEYDRSRVYQKEVPSARVSSTRMHTGRVRDGDRCHYPESVLRAEAFLRRQRGLSSTLGQMSRADLRSYLKRTAKRSKCKLNFDELGDLSSDTATSGVSSSVCSGVPDNGQEWQTVLHSIQKINSNIQDVWTALGYRHEPVIRRPATAPFRLAYRNSSPTVFLPGESALNHSSIDSGLSKGASDSRSLAERTQAIKQWLQQSRSQLNSYNNGLSYKSQDLNA